MFEWLLEGDADPMAADADSAKPEADNEKQQQQQVKIQKGGKNGDKTITTVPELIRYMRATTKDRMKPIDFKLNFINSRRLERFGFVAEPEESPEALWEKKYKRRVFALNAGRLTLFYKPFACLGEIETDAIKMFLDAYTAYLDEIPKFSYNFSQSIPKFVPTMVMDADRRKTLAMKPYFGEICEFRKREKLCRAGGKKQLKEALAELRSRITAVSCGIDYKEHVLRCLAERDFLEKLLAGYFKDDRTMEVKPLTESAFVPVAEFIELKARPATGLMSQRSSQAGSSVPLSSFIQFKNRKNLRIFQDRIMYVYLFLCSLHNIRTKQLKTKHLIPVSAQRALRRDPFLRKQEDSLFYKQTATKTASSDTIATSSPRESARQSMAMGLPTLKRGHLLTRDRSAESRLRMGGNQRTVRVETWEDLLTIGTQPRQLKSLRQKTLPPWQMKWDKEDEFVTQRRTRRENTTTPVITGNMHRKLSRVADGEDAHVQTYHPQEALMRMRLGILKVNERSKKALMGQISKLDRERMTQYSYKTQVFDDLPQLWEGCRNALDRASDRARRDPSNIKEHIEPWFRALQDVCVAGDVRDEPLINDFLKKIERFLLLDELSCIPFILEKFCIIVVSMPIYEILQPHVQWAVAFVLTEILEGKLSMLVEWLNYRRLYLVEQNYQTSAT